MTQNCPLCAPEGEHVIVENDKFRIIRVDDPEFPGYFRLIWQDHLKEVSDLDPGDRLVMWDALTRLEEAVIEAMHPEGAVRNDGAAPALAPDSAFPGRCRVPGQLLESAKKRNRSQSTGRTRAGSTEVCRTH